MHIIAAGMIQFDIFNVFVENSALLYSNQPKYEICQKMPIFEQLIKEVPVNSKDFSTPH